MTAPPAAPAGTPWLHEPLALPQTAARVILVGLALTLGLPIPWISTASGLLLLAWCVAGGWQVRARQLWQDPPARIALLLLVWMIVSIGWSTVEPGAAAGDIVRYRGLLVFLIARTLIQEPSWAWRVTVAFLVGCGIAAAGASLRWFGLVDVAHQICSFGGSCGRIGMSLMLAFTAWLAWGLWLIQPARRTLWVVAGAFAIVWLFYLNTGRTGQIALLAVVPLAFYRQWRWRGVAAGCALAAILVGVVSMTSAAVQSRIRSSSEQLDRALGGDFRSDEGNRLEMYATALTLLRQHPIAGSGAGSFEGRFEAQAVTDGRALTRAVRNPHNEYLRIGVQQGIVGVALFIGLGWALCARARGSGLVQCTLVSGFVLMFYMGCLANSLLFDIPESFMFGLLVTASGMLAREGVPPPSHI